ncbi:alpha/beta hydrolase [Thalassobaculum sp.]|uniref:alpha/beta hydrolase n=1 Tax=Thalassobaculum sp. TaxID=2022740 RepID=UPI0032EE879F
MPEVTINGPEGRIEGRYLHAAEPNAPIALMLHPHPQHGGTMNNKVVYSMYQTFVARGFSTLRFNFRGVGRSQGVYTGGEGELSDAATALDWLQTYNPNAKYCWIGGFSFGAWIGMQLLMRRPEITGFVSIAPPANMFDFTFLAPCPASGIMVQGDQDDIVTPESVKKLVDKLSAQRGITITHTVIKGANHFFGQQIDQLTDIVGTYLDKSIAAHDKASA